MYKQPPTITRRRLLQALSLGVGAEVLSQLWPQRSSPFLRSAYGQEMGEPRKRLFIFFSPNGAVPHRFFPTGEGSQFQISPDSVLSPLSVHKDDLVILEGLNFLTGNNHEGGMHAMLTNGDGDESVTHQMSIDQYIASQLPQNITPLPSLELGVLTDPWGASIQTRMCYQTNGQMVHPDSDPRSVFRRLFGSSDSDEEGAARAQGYRRSVIDLVRADLTELNQRVGGTERVKLDKHLTSIREVEQRLIALNNITCQPPAVPPRLNKDQYALCPELTSHQLDLAMLAFVCDLTSIITFQLSHTVSPVVFSWAGNTETHHSLSHAADQTTQLDQFILAEQWCAQQFKDIIDRFKRTPDPINGGTLFDHTVIVWAKEMGDSRLHICDSVPFVLAGTGAGAWETGRMLRCGGQSHSHLLVSLCHAMGLDNQTFGDPSTGVGSLSNLYT